MDSLEGNLGFSSKWATLDAVIGDRVKWISGLVCDTRSSLGVLEFLSSGLYFAGGSSWFRNKIIYIICIRLFYHSNSVYKPFSPEIWHIKSKEWFDFWSIFSRWLTEKASLTHRVRSVHFRAPFLHLMQIKLPQSTFPTPGLPLQGPDLKVQRCRFCLGPLSKVLMQNYSLCSTWITSLLLFWTEASFFSIFEFWGSIHGQS